MRAFCRVAAALIIVLLVSAFNAGCYYGAKPYLSTVRTVCADYSVEPELVLAVMKAESGFDTNASSGAGAVGIMQILPDTAQWICAMRAIEYDESKLKEAEYNIGLGVWYLEYLAYFGDRDWQLAAYNAGEGTVKGWIKEGLTVENIPYSETRTYVKKVNAYYTLFKTRKFFN